MNEDSVFNLIKDCTKIFTEIKKKKNEDLDTSLNNCLNTLSVLKENISHKQDENIEENLLIISNSFIEAANKVINLKYTKYFLNILLVLKKFLEYSIFSKEKSDNLIDILYDIHNNSKANEESQNKVLEIFQTFIFTSYFELKYDSLSKIYLLILKSFTNTSNNKNKDFKNPIRLLFTTITEKVYKSNDFEIITKITVLIFSWYYLSQKKKAESSRKITKENPNEDNNNSNINLEKNKNNDEFSYDIDNQIKEEINKIINNHKKNKIYIQCLSLELLSQGISLILNKKDKDNNQFGNFIKGLMKGKVKKAINISIENIKKSISILEEPLNYLLFIKIIKFLKIILFNYNDNYEIIQPIIDLLKENNAENKISWKKKLSFEFLSTIIANKQLLEKIGNWEKELLESLFSSINKFIDNIELLKDDKEFKRSNTVSEMKRKGAEDNKIYLEGDEIVIVKEKSARYYKNQINECLLSLIDCLVKEHFFKNDDNKNSENKNQFLDKDIFDIICNNLRDIIFKLIKNEKNINIKNNADSDIKLYFNYIKNMMGLFINLNMPKKVEEYFKILSELALDFPKEKKQSDEKNIFLALNLLNLSKTPKSLNKECYIIVLQTIEIFNHKYNFLRLSDYSKNDLDKIIKDINELFLNKKLTNEAFLKNKNDKTQKEEQMLNNNDLLEKENEETKINIIDISELLKDEIENENENEKEKEEENDEEKKENEHNEIIKKDSIKIVEIEEKDNIEILETEKNDEKEEDIKKIEVSKKDNEKKAETNKDKIKEDSKKDNEKKEDIKKSKEKKEDSKKDKEKNKEVKTDKEKKEVKKDNEKEESKKDKERKKEDKKDTYKDEIRKILCHEIDKMFTDSKYLDLESIKSIIDALLSCIDLSIEKNNSKKKNELSKKESKDIKSNKDKEKKAINNEDEENLNYEIIFFYSKLLTIALTNEDKFYILFDPLMTVINKLLDNKIMLDFSVEILCSLIPEIILKYHNIKTNINKSINEENKIWIDERWQKLLFSPLLTLLSQVELFAFIKDKIFVGLNKIIQQSGHYIDLYGWESIIQTCVILSNFDVEKTFFPIKSTLNDYCSYLTLLNLIPIMNLLQVFISNKKDKNISFSSVELFWSCANLIDDFKQGKRVMEDKEKPLLEKLIKGKEIKLYCDELYEKLFSYLININDDERLDVRKSGLNVFTEIFVSKMSNIAQETRLKIINEIFFKIFCANTDKFILDSKNNELEQALQISLLDILKILKEFFNINEGENKIFEDFLNKLTEIIPIASPLLNTDVLKSILEIKLNKNENTSMIVKKLDMYFKIIALINEYIKGSNFVISQFNKVPAYKLFNSILLFIGNIFLDDNYLEIYTDDNLKIVIEIFKTLFDSIYTIEPKLLELKPRKLVDFENDIFNLIEKMPIQNNTIFNFIIDRMNFDIKNLHTDAISRRLLECFKNMISKKENKFGLKKEEYEIFKKLKEKIKEIILLSTKNEVIESLSLSKIEENEEKIPFHIYLDHFIKIIDEMCNNLLKHKEKLNNDNEIKEDKNEIINNLYEFFILIIDLFECIFNQHITGFKSINQIYYPMINEVYNRMEINSIQFIINKLIFYVLSILGDEDENAYKKIEEKILKLIKIICDISNMSNYDNNNLSLPSLNLVTINELFKICKYKSNEEIKNEINDKKIINIDKYIGNQIKVRKMFSNLAIQKINDIFKKFREDEIKSGDMPLSRLRIKEIVNLMENVKNLEIFPDINLIEENENKENEKKEITVFDVLSKTKKIHLFYLQPILIDFIDTKEKEIKQSVKEIFQIINEVMGMPKLKKLDL